MAESATATASPAARPVTAKGGKPSAAKPAATKPPAAKPAKDKRSKAQIAADDNAAETRKLLEYWLKLKSFFLLAFSDRPITPESEQQFLETMTLLQKQQRLALQSIPRDISIGANQMNEMLRGAISIEHLRSLPESDKAKLLAVWHSIYILMARAAGAMNFIAEGYKFVSQEKDEVGLLGIKRTAGGQKDVPWNKNTSVWTGIVVGAIFLAFLLYYLDIIKL